MTEPRRIAAALHRGLLQPGLLRRLGGLTFAVFALAAINLAIGEHYPFSNFPMFGNPSPGAVDYYFLTDAQGNPMATRATAGVTAPAIKKMIARGVAEERKKAESTRSAKSGGEEVQRAARVVLDKLHRDASRSPLPLDRWPPGVKLFQGLIEPTPQGFRESFRLVAALPGTEAETTTSPPRVGREDDDPNRETRHTLQVFFRAHLVLMAALVALLVGWPSLPVETRRWLSVGADGGGVGRLEAFCLRLALAFVFWQALQVRVHFDTLPHPQGLATMEWLHPVFAWLGNAEHWNLVKVAASALLVWYVCGWAQFLPLTVLTLLHILQRTLFASQGATHHGHQLLTLVFCAQTVMAWALVCCRMAGLRRWWTRPGSHTAIWQGVLVVVASVYVTSAGFKLVASQGRWLFHSHHLSAQIVKTHRQNYYNDLDPQFLVGGPSLPPSQADSANDRYRLPIPVQAEWIRRNPSPARVFFGLGLLLEALAFMAAFNRGLASAFGVALVLFHLLVLELMRLDFPLNVATVWVVLVNPAGWLVLWRGAGAEGGSGSEPGDSGR